jgi:hypothetical protein
VLVLPIPMFVLRLAMVTVTVFFNRGLPLKEPWDYYRASGQVCVAPRPVRLAFFSGGRHRCALEITIWRWHIACGNREFLRFYYKF